MNAESFSAVFPKFCVCSYRIYLFYHIANVMAENLVNGLFEGG